jgi:hypothetical protein
VGRELSYAWSWCPSRADSTAAFECNVSEQQLERAWVAAGLDGSPPAYALGTEPEVELTHVLSPALVAALCQTPTGDDALDERLALACFEGLAASVKLTVRTSEEELTALKSLTLLMAETPDSERNTNPTSDFEVTVRDDAGDALVESDQPLRAGHRYTIAAGLDDAIAESFTPSGRPGEPQAGERRETLIMTWFVTVGEVVASESDEAFGDESPRTAFVPGSNDFENLLKNSWEVPLNAGSSAELRLVLRDERGGVGWTARRFDVIGGEK